MLLVSVDDTDSRDGGCTTWLAARLREAFPECEVARPPRLVRLNPNVPWKTRGNAAVALALDDGGALAPEDALGRARAVVERHARLGAPGTEPGVVVARRPPRRALYERAVRGIVPREEAFRALDEVSALHAALDGGRGVIGAAAALAWTPEDRTFELVAYRARERWGTPRDVPDADVAALDALLPSSFDCFDHENREVVMVPSSPCPVLWGVRGDDAAELPRALGLVGGERPAEWTLFETNQATDDHLSPASCATAAPLASVAVAARVTGAPRDVNGHVFVDLADATGRLRAAAYAPTEGFRAVVRALREGDEVVACGGVKPGPDGALTLALEKLKVEALSRARVKVANPACASCGARMKSAGAGAGYRCRSCGARAAPGDAEHALPARGVAAERWYEVPARARRHLAKPLRRGPPPARALPRATPVP